MSETFDHDIRDTRGKRPSLEGASPITRTPQEKFTEGQPCNSLYQLREILISRDVLRWTNDLPGTGEAINLINEIGQSLVAYIKNQNIEGIKEFTEKLLIPKTSNNALPEGKVLNRLNFLVRKLAEDLGKELRILEQTTNLRKRHTETIMNEFWKSVQKILNKHLLENNPTEK